MRPDRPVKSVKPVKPDVPVKKEPTTPVKRKPMISESESEDDVPLALLRTQLQQGVPKELKKNEHMTKPSEEDVKPPLPPPSFSPSKSAAIKKTAKSSKKAGVRYCHAV